MGLKQSWSKAVGWMAARRAVGGGDGVDIDNDGLINQHQSDTAGTAVEHGGDHELIVKSAQRGDKNQSIEKMQEGFNRLIDQLQGINENLNQQMSRHTELMHHMGQMPEVLENFPKAIENQKKIAEQLLDQLNGAKVREQQFIDAVERIPMQTAKQTDALVNIDHQLAASAEVEVQAAENFGKFNKALDKLEQSTANQTDGILQMSKTFATSDRYFKYIISKQNRRFMWLFACSVGICVILILVLTGIIIWLGQ